MSHLPIQDPVLVFAVVAGLIVLAPIVMARYRLPGMVGLLLAGAILGPHATGVLAHDASFVLFGTVGLLYLMFGAALEIDSSVLRRHWLASSLFGVLTFAIPFGAGLVVGRIGLGLGWPATLLICSVFASHTLLGFPIASRLGLAHQRAVTASVGATFLSEPLALFALALVASGPEQSLDTANLVRILAALVGYCITAALVLPRVSRWFFRTVAEDGIAEFSFVLAALFLFASLGRLIGIEPVVGVFIAGLALNQVIPRTSPLMARLRFTGDALFVPFFLLSIGMLLDPRRLSADPRAWLITIVIIVATVGTKWLAATLARWMLRMSRAEGRVLLGMSLPHAAGTLATTLIGFRLKLFDESIVNAVIVLILVSCILGPWLVDSGGRLLALESPPPLFQSDSGPPQRILVALAKPATAEPLLALATLLRDERAQQPVYPLTVITQADPAHEHVGEAEELLAKATAQLSEAGVPAMPLTRVDPSIASAIGRARQEVFASDVLVGWSPRSDSRPFFGTMLEKLLHASNFTLIASRLVSPLGGTHRLLLLVPPFAEHEGAFPGALERMRTLAHALGVGVSLVGEQARLDAALRTATRGRAPVSLVGVADWGALVEGLQPRVEPGDLLVLIGARKGALSWRHDSEGLPAALVEVFPLNNLLLVYPEEPSPSLA